MLCRLEVSVTSLNDVRFESTVTYIAEQIAGVEQLEWGWCLPSHVSDIITPASRRHKDTQQLLLH